jgi:phage tail sheath protein FI
MATYKTPGVYVEEISTLPPSVAEVATAVPAFVGYTETGPTGTADPTVVRVSTMLEFETACGGAQPAKFSVSQHVDEKGAPTDSPVVEKAGTDPAFALYYAIAHYFRNGGGPCYVVSVGNYTAAPQKERFAKGIDALEKEDEPTLLVLTDAAVLLSAADYYDLCGTALAQCKKLGDRFTIVDVVPQAGKKDWQAFRDSPGLSTNLMYGAAYLPYLQTSIPYRYRDADVQVTRVPPPSATASGTLNLGGTNGIDITFVGPSGSTPGVVVTFGRKTFGPDFSVAAGTLTIVDANSKTGADIVTAWTTWKQTAANDAAGFEITRSGDGSAVAATADVARTAVPLPTSGGATGTLQAIRGTATAVYNRAKAALEERYVTLPPSAAMAGIYARVDRENGVWKAPANTGVLAVLGPVAKITDDDQDQLNVDPTAGKSINAIRAFTGKGTLVWGARTLAGNDNEWRYIPVRRLFIMIEESSKKASAFAVFEANDQSTWLKVKAMIESYLYGLWQQGALAGSKPEDAYYVHVGLGTTMTPQDVLEGRMIVEIGVAAVRPAEFIVLRFSHKLQTA